MYHHTSAVLWRLRHNTADKSSVCMSWPTSVELVHRVIANGRCTFRLRRCTRVAPSPGRIHRARSVRMSGARAAVDVCPSQSLVPAFRLGVPQAASPSVVRDPSRERDAIWLGVVLSASPHGLDRMWRGARKTLTTKGQPSHRPSGFRPSPHDGARGTERDGAGSTMRLPDRVADADRNGRHRRKCVHARSRRRSPRRRHRDAAARRFRRARSLHDGPPRRHGFHAGRAGFPGRGSRCRRCRRGGHGGGRLRGGCGADRRRPRSL